MRDLVYIIILNWNDWKCTIECLESIQQLNHSFYRIVLIDNGSSDNSLEQIKAWASGEIPVNSKYINNQSENRNLFIVQYNRNLAEIGGNDWQEHDMEQRESAKKLVIIDNNENLGFAVGNNVGIRYSIARGAKYVWLLNNDTVVEKESLSNLVDFLETNVEYKGVTPQIRLYDKPDIIWNCGGILKWYGVCKYYFPNKSYKLVPQTDAQTISFITCCAAIFRTSLFNELGLLTERFFLGEEDFELSQRIKKHRYRLACLYEAIIYHKVGQSYKGSHHLGHIYIHLLCRYINLRHHWPKSIWYIWRIASVPYILLLVVFKHKYRYSDAWDLIQLLFRNSIILDEVKKHTHMEALAFNRNRKSKFSIKSSLV